MPLFEWLSIGAYYAQLLLIFYGLRRMELTGARRDKQVEQQGEALKDIGKALEQQGKALEQQGKALEQQGKALEDIGTGIRELLVRTSP